MKHISLALFMACIIQFSCTKDDTFIKQEKSVSVQNSGFTTQNISKAANRTHASVVNFANGGQVVGDATLVRSPKGLSFDFSANDLTEGYTYTIWFVIWNSPGECTIPNQCGEGDLGNAQVQVEIMYGTGHVVGKSGVGHFGGHLKVGDVSGSANDLFGLPSPGGLLDPMAAEVHIVLRNHGPAIQGEVNEQIGSYVGGCDNSFPPFTQIPDEVGECGDTHAAIFAPPAG